MLKLWNGKGQQTKIFDLIKDIWFYEVDWLNIKKEGIENNMYEH